MSESIGDKLADIAWGVGVAIIVVGSAAKFMVEWWAP